MQGLQSGVLQTSTACGLALAQSWLPLHGLELPWQDKETQKLTCMQTHHPHQEPPWWYACPQSSQQ